MIGPRADNSISDGDNNTQVGHNAGTISVGLTFEQHEAAMERAIARKEADLERAHTAEKALIQRELDELRRRMLDMDADYQARLNELADTKAMLARFDNQIERTRFDQAMAALDNDDESLAVDILTELAEAKARRREDEAREEAKIQFKLGEISESRVEWASAARHYARAAELDPTYDSLVKAGELLWRAGRYAAALEMNKKLVALSRQEYDPRDLKTATALNNYAESLRATGRYPEAEPLFREALEIGRERLGDRHPDVATCLNNYASLLNDTGRTAEAEPLFREVLGIGRERLGNHHPHVATWLNNLAGLLDATGRHSEAELLYCEALVISRKSLGNRHPAVANRLNNFASLLEDTGRSPEAEPLYREALEISRELLGNRHPDVATLLNNFAGLLRTTNRADQATPLILEALGIHRTSLGDDHPATQTTAQNTLIHLRQYAPDHPDLAALLAVFGDGG